MFFFPDNKFICDCKLAWIKGVRNETINNDLKNSLDLLTCFLESRNHTLIDENTAEDIVNENNNNGEKYFQFM